MHDLVTIETPKPPQQRQRAEIKISPKVRVAVEAMVWQALPRKAAAEHAGISEHGLYKALRKPPVKAFYLSELEVLRTSERARNFHTLCDVRDQTTNQMARVNAVKAIEQLGDEQQSNAGSSRSPGVLIVVGDKASVSVSAIEPKPLIQHVLTQDDEASGA